MNLDVHFPLLLRGRPERSRGDRDILLAYRHTAEVPEISFSEMELVATGRLNLFAGREGAVNFAAPQLNSGETDYPLAVHAGRLYKRMGIPTPGFVADRLRKVFASSGDLAAVSMPVMHHYLRVLSSNCLNYGRPPERERLAWPVVEDRNETVFGEMQGRIAAYDERDLATALAMYERRCEGLLSVSGVLWVETNPPSYAITWNGLKVNIFRTLTRPEWFEGGTINRHYPLTRRQEAAEYAAWLGKRPGGETFDLSAQFEWTAAEALEFDDDLAQASLMAGSLSMTCARLLGADDDLRDRQDGALLAVLAEANESLGDANYVLGKRDDLSAFLPDLYRLWKAMGRPRANATFGVESHRFIDMVVERAIADLDHRPIEVTNFAPSQAPGVPTC